MERGTSVVWTNWKDRRGGKEKIKEADDGEIDDLCGLWYNYGRSSVRDTERLGGRYHGHGETASDNFQVRQISHLREQMIVSVILKKTLN